MATGHLSKYPNWVGGRRRINAERRAKADSRLREVLMRYHVRGETQASIARRFGLHRSTICRQIKQAYARGWRAKPIVGAYHNPLLSDAL